MARPRLPGKDVRKIRRRLWDQQRKKCYWCQKVTVLPQHLFERYLPLDDLYQQGLAEHLSILHQQLMQKEPEFRRIWENDLATVDHLIEHARGGSYDDHNVVLACSRCNTDRGLAFAEALDSEEDLLLGSEEHAATPIIIPPDSEWSPN